MVLTMLLPPIISLSFLVTILCSAKFFFFFSQPSVTSVSYIFYTVEGGEWSEQLKWQREQSGKIQQFYPFWLQNPRMCSKSHCYYYYLHLLSVPPKTMIYLQRKSQIKLYWKKVSTLLTFHGWLSHLFFFFFFVFFFWFLLTRAESP